jgi:CRISPR-associated protein Cmr2
MKSYLALTIGPIYKTLSHAKKTRELWGGSYIFSYIMREIIARLDDREFIVPFTMEKRLFESGRQVGLFHDRFIFEAREGDRERLEQAVEQVLQNLARDTGLDPDFVQSYFRIHIVEKALNEGDNPILQITPYLDAAELFYTVGQYGENSLTKMLQGNNTFLNKDAFGEKKSFPSLPEIALYDMIVKDPGIRRRINRDDELGIYEEKGLDFKPYHKYYAIVHADGDNMGKVIAGLKKKEDFQHFSKKLFEYCEASHKTISAFGGETIFAGGDDLLFFAPVVSGDKTIFDLCEEISRVFDGYFASEATLSFGVSIQYHKFPLYEALEKSRSLLFGDAKEGEKNNIAFSVTKHSGQTFGATVPKSQKELYENFRLFSANIKGGEGLDNFLGSLHHKLDTHAVLLSRIGRDKSRLEAFFVNYFNKEAHEQYGELFSLLTEFMHEAYSNSKPEDALKIVYATLRFVKFIQGDKS